MATDLLTAREAADFLRCSPSLVYGLARRQLIPHLRIASKILFRRESLEAWVAQQEVQARAPVELKVVAGGRR